MARPSTRNSFRIAIICALPEEKDAVEALFVEKYPLGFGKHHLDRNIYSYGELGGQPVVLVCLRDMGARFASQVARDMYYSFEGIEIAFVVGITGCAPFRPDGSQTGTRLGDVIISTSMLEYDFGKQHENRFETIMAHERRLPKAGEIVQTFLKAAQGKKLMEALNEATNKPLQETQLKGAEYESPGRRTDHIFRSDYIHKHQRPEDCETCARWTRHGDPVCFDTVDLHVSVPNCEELGCVPGKYDLGTEREDSKIFFGPYVSGSGVMKSAHRRDVLVGLESREEGEALAFEMEGPGVWDTFPTMIVKGVVDYADSHKNKSWRLYPAARAALCTAQIIREMDMGLATTATGAQSSASDAGKFDEAPTVSDAQLKQKEITAFRVSLYNNTSNYDDQRSVYMARAHNTCQWICDDHRQVQSFLNGSGPRLLWISGHAGCGKSYIAAFLTERLQEARGNIVCHYFLNTAGDNPDTALRIICALLHQLCAHQRAAHAAYDIYQSLAKGDACLSEMSTVWQMLCAAATAVGPSEGKVYLCIDGLDQCSPEFMRPLLKLLESVLKGNAAQNVVSEEKHDRTDNWRILITSRSHPDITTRLSQFAECRVELEGSQSVVQQDLGAVVAQRMEELREYHASDEELEAFIKNILLKQAGSTFLWIKVVCNRLDAAKHLNRKKVQSIVQSSPKDLDSLYAQMLQCEEADVELTKMILQVIMAAAQPFSVDALNLAVAIRVSDVRLDQVGVERNFERTLRQLCGSLLTISSQKLVTFLHQTVSDFLTKGTAIIGEGTEKNTLLLDAMEAQRHLATKCMAYLLLEEFGDSTFQRRLKGNRRGSVSEMLDDKHKMNDVRKGALFRYAASHWQTHFAVHDKNRDVDLSDGDRDAVNRLLDPEYFGVWSISPLEGLSGVLDWVTRQHQIVMALTLVRSNVQAIANLPPQESILARCAVNDNSALLEPLLNEYGRQSSIWSEENHMRSLHVAAGRKNASTLAQLLRYADVFQRKLSTGTVRELLCKILGAKFEAHQAEPCVKLLLEIYASSSEAGNTLEHGNEPDQCPVCAAADSGDMPVLDLFDAFRRPIDLHAVARSISARHLAISARFLEILVRAPEACSFAWLTQNLQNAATTGQIKNIRMLLQCMESVAHAAGDHGANARQLVPSNRTAEFRASTLFQTCVGDGLRYLSNGRDRTTAAEFQSLLEYLTVEDGSLLAFLALRRREEAISILIRKFGRNYDETALKGALLAGLMRPYLSAYDVVLAMHPADYKALRMCQESPNHDLAAGIVERMLQQIWTLRWEDLRQKLSRSRGTWQKWTMQKWMSEPHQDDKPYNSWCEILELFLGHRPCLFPNWLWTGMLRPPQLVNMVNLLLAERFVLPDHLWPTVLLSCAQHLDHATKYELFQLYVKSQTAETSRDTLQTTSLLARILDLPQDFTNTEDTTNAMEFADVDVVLDAVDFHLIRDLLLDNCQLNIEDSRGSARAPRSGDTVFVTVQLETKVGNSRGGFLSFRTKGWFFRNSPAFPQWLPTQIKTDADLHQQARTVTNDKSLDADQFHQRVMDIFVQSAQRQMASLLSDVVQPLLHPFPVRLEYKVHLSALSWALATKKVALAQDLICQQNVDIWHQSETFEALQQPTLLKQAVTAGLENEVIAWVVRNKQSLGRPDSAGTTLLHYIITSAVPWNTADTKLEPAKELISRHNLDVWQDSDTSEALEKPTLLEQAVSRGLQKELISWIVRNKQHFSRRDSAGATLLHYVAKYSARSDDIGVLRTLCLEHKASIQAKDAKQQTPLDYARSVSKGQESPAMHFLLEFGAQYNEDRNDKWSGSDMQRSDLSEFDFDSEDEDTPLDETEEDGIETRKRPFAEVEDTSTDSH